MHSMADELITDGVDTIVVNTHRHTFERGFNEENDNHLVLNNRGDYVELDGNGDRVAYAVDDMVKADDGFYYRCTFPIDSTTPPNSGVTPTGDFTNNANRFWTPTQVHLVDAVHWSERGSRLSADANVLPFLVTSASSTTELSQSTIDDIAAAVADNSPTEIPVQNFVAANQPIIFNLVSADGTEPAVAPTPGNFVVSVPSAVTVSPYSAAFGYQVTITPNDPVDAGQVVSVTGFTLGEVLRRQWLVGPAVSADGGVLVDNDAIAEATEQRLLNEMDGEAFMQLLADRLEQAINDEADGSMTLAGLVSLIRSDLERAGGLLETSANGVGLSAADINAIAAAILASPTNPIATNSSGAVTTSNPTTGGVGSAHTPADVVTALLQQLVTGVTFPAGSVGESIQDVFKDGDRLRHTRDAALSDEPNGIVTTTVTKVV